MAYNQKINSRDKDTPGAFREDQENKYTNLEGDPTKKEKNINLSTTFKGKKSAVTPSVMIKNGKLASGSVNFSKTFGRGHEVSGEINKGVGSPTNLNVRATFRLGKR